MDDDPLHRMGPVVVSIQVLLTDHGEASPAAIGWDMGISTAGEGDSGSVVRRMEEYVLSRHNTVTQYILT